MRNRSNHQMAVRVGVLVQDHQGGGTAVERKRLTNVVGLRRDAEDALLRRGAFRRGQVGIPPGGEKGFHERRAPKSECEGGAVLVLRSASDTHSMSPASAKALLINSFNSLPGLK